MQYIPCQQVTRYTSTLNTSNFRNKINGQLTINAYQIPKNINKLKGEYDLNEITVHIVKLIRNLQIIEKKEDAMHWLPIDKTTNQYFSWLTIWWCDKQV